jgi:epsilon-lactone hydrolase
MDPVVRTKGEENQMPANEALPSLDVPARLIPVPSSISPEAQSMLAMGTITSPEFPPLEDHEAWRRFRAESEEVVLSYFTSRFPKEGITVTKMEVDGVGVFAIDPPDVDPDDPRVYFDIHGGGLTMGGGECCRAVSTLTALNVGMHLWTVDYRMPPDDPYPAALDDCLAVYRALLRDHSADQIVVGGGSAGGNLATALILRARDEGLPLPAALVLLSPEVDLTESGDSFQTNLGVDTVLTRSLMPANLLYAGGHDLSDPYVSPLFGDFARGFPPALISSGTRDLFLSNAVRLHRALRAAGISADLHVLEAAPHGGFMFETEEDQALDAEIRSFIEEHCPRTNPLR